jgi:hypothetical protein
LFVLNFLFPLKRKSLSIEKRYGEKEEERAQNPITSIFYFLSQKRKKNCAHSKRNSEAKNKLKRYLLFFVERKNIQSEGRRVK